MADDVQIKKVNVLKKVSEQLKLKKQFWINHLLKIETMATAIDEVEKTIHILSSYEKELLYLENREPIGKFRVSLPYNNPIYSFVLYSCGIALAGNEVIVRPSKITQQFVIDFYNMFQNEWHSIGIRLYVGPGQCFINNAYECDEPGGLLFTGSYEHIKSILQSFPKEKHLIYCGQGNNPIIVGPKVDSLSDTIDIVVNSRIYNSGQDCLCSEKILVHDNIFERFCNSLVSALSEIKLGYFGDPSADIFPPMEEMQNTVFSKYDEIAKEGKKLFMREFDGAILAAFEVDINSNALNSEKFSPIFTIARYNSDDQLYRLSKSDYKFGAIILGGADENIWKEFPHVVNDKTVIQLEAEDSHVPFGGKGKSGFSRYKNYYKDGPILFSVESSKIKKGNY